MTVVRMQLAVDVIKACFGICKGLHRSAAAQNATQNTKSQLQQLAHMHKHTYFICTHVFGGRQRLEHEYLLMHFYSRPVGASERSAGTILGRDPRISQDGKTAAPTEHFVSVCLSLWSCLIS